MGQFQRDDATSTVVLSRDATVGRCGILSVPMATSQHFVNYICGPDFDPEYLLLTFRWPMQWEFQRLTMGSTLRTIGLPDVDSFRIALPPIDEQREIVLRPRAASATRYNYMQLEFRNKHLAGVQIGNHFRSGNRNNSCTAHREADSNSKGESLFQARCLGSKHCSSTSGRLKSRADEAPKALIS